MFNKVKILLFGTILIVFGSIEANVAFSKEDLTQGKELYLRYGCALCHGKNGLGDGLNVNKSYPSPTNFHDVQAYRHGSEKESIIYSIENGIREDSSIMPAFRHIPTEELNKIVGYLTSLQTKKQGVAEDTRKDIVVSNAWVRLMPPSQKTTAAYMVIENNSDKEMVLESASTDVASMTHLHRMGHSNGMMTMGSAGEVRIPAKSKAVLEPGGLHLMLIGLKKPLNKGDVVVMILHFQGGNNIVIKADVHEEDEK